MIRSRILLLWFLSLASFPAQSFEVGGLHSPHARTSINLPGPDAFKSTHNFLVAQKRSRVPLHSVAIVHEFRRFEKEEHSRNDKVQPFDLPPAPPPKFPRNSSSTYDKRIEEWANLYTSIESLRQRFGRNQNTFWGDLHATTARRLYKTLMPSALLPLVQIGVKPQDLAPLAYEARVAAKLYVRERSRFPARISAKLFDGFRQLRRYGRFNTHGMTYEQVWQKYRKVILDDCEKEGSCSGLTEDDVAAQICLKILEKSCSTNQYIDRLFESSNDQQLGEDLKQISAILEADIHRLLDPIKLVDSKPADYQIRRFHTLKKIARIKKRLLGKSTKRRKRSREI